MICLGLDDASKRERVARYRADHGIRNVFALGPSKFQLPLDDIEWIEWASVIQYRFYYRLLQEIGSDTLVVVNECLRTQDRHDLTYNCIRNFLNQTTHQIVFQRLPIIDTIDDFMILVDFDTRSRWKREKWRTELRAETAIDGQRLPVALRRIDIETDATTRAAYAREKRRLIDDIGLRDPHTIPRNLHLFAGKAKVKALDSQQRYVGRNNRFKLPHLETYEEARGNGERVAFEFCHRFIDFSDFLAQTNTTQIDALVSDLKVDAWYFERFTGWARRLDDAYATLLG